jgi:hypothetical protein
MNNQPFSKKRKLCHTSSRQFNRTPAANDDQESPNDNLFYVYDARKKTLVSNHKLYTASKCSMTLPTDANATFALRPLGNGQQLNLFSMCLRFVADNLHLVDSLEGFPSLVGEVLFSECVKCDKFNAKKDSFSSVEAGLVLFAKSYPESLIEKLSLANKKLALNSLKTVLSLCNIQSLNLSGCSLMSLETNLADILKASQSTLKDLNLSSNELDENFLKKFTLPQRLGYVNFEKLENLDLQDNPDLESFSNIKYLSKYGSLNRVVLSRRGAPLKSAKKEDLNGFRICSCPSEKTSRMHQLANSGWISRVNIEDLVSVEESSKHSQMSSVEGLILLFLFREVRILNQSKKINTIYIFYWCEQKSGIYYTVNYCK